MSNTIQIRTITPADWPAILELQARTYYAVEPESEAVMRSKQQLGPQSCLVACSGEQLLGYCLAHPWSKEEPASLYHCYAEPKGHTSLYIHDMVVAPSARGKGIARSFLTQLEQLARQRHAERVEQRPAQPAATTGDEPGCRAGGGSLLVKGGISLPYSGQEPAAVWGASRLYVAARRNGRPFTTNTAIKI